MLDVVVKLAICLLDVAFRLVEADSAAGTLGIRQGSTSAKWMVLTCFDMKNSWPKFGESLKKALKMVREKQPCACAFRPWP